jgi:O-antigen/teichoic acid export membrane protein
VSVEGDQLRAHVNTLACISGVAVMALGALVSGGYFLLTSDASISALGVSLSLWILLGSLISPQEGILTARGQIALIGQLQIISEVAGLIAGVVTLYQGWGIFALAASKLAYQVVSLGGLLLASRWFPVTRLIRTMAHGVFMESWHIAASRIIGFAGANCSLYLIGIFSGPADAGIFRVAMRVASSIKELVNEPTRLLSWSGFRTVRAGTTEEDRNHRVSERAADIIGTLCFFSVPLFVGLAVTSVAMVQLLLGAEWAASAPIVALLSIAALVQSPSAIILPLLTMVGKVATYPRLATFTLTISLLCVTAFAPWGLFSLTVGQLVAAFVEFVANVVILRRLGGVDLKPIGSKLVPILVAAAAMAGCVFLVRDISSNVIIVLVTQVTLGMAAYALCTTILAREQVAAIFRMVARRGAAPS